MLLATCDPSFLPGALLAILFQATVLGCPAATKERQVGEMRVLTLRLQKETASGEEIFSTSIERESWAQWHTPVT